MNPPRLILFAGHAGTGKTTLAKQALPQLAARSGRDYFFLDKDTAYGAFSSHVMGLLTGDPADRDSPTYLEHLRDREYAGLLDITREIMAGKFFRPQELGLPANTICRIAWIDLSSDEARRRIERRADPRDAWKLAHWDSYLQRRVEPPEHPGILRFDNSAFDAPAFDKLVAHLLD